MINEHYKVAVLLTCFNRKNKTLHCLERLFTIEKNLTVYLVDDGCTDGTAQEIERMFPTVIVIKAEGNLFWNRGMHLAWDHAAKEDYDFYIWLNDDVLLYDNCFEELFQCLELSERNIIVSGIIETEDKRTILYGGFDENGRLIQATGQLNPITNLNGNVVLITKATYSLLGNLDPFFHHDLGDVEYGLRAQKMGIGVYTTRIPVASGEKNNICRVRLNGTSIKKRLKRLYSPLGANPSIIFYFRRKYYGLFNAALYFVFLHIINIFPDKLNRLIFGNRYI
jgi:GT2 family glycosyltransferase